MAKLGMSKGKSPVFSGKLAEDDLDKVVNSNLPPKEFFANYASNSMAEASTVLRETLDNARPRFISRLSQEIEIGFHDGELPILPDHTRYYHKDGDNVTLMLEVSPHLRSINFQSEGDKGYQ